MNQVKYKNHPPYDPEKAKQAAYDLQQAVMEAEEASEKFRIALKESNRLLEISRKAGKKVITCQEAWENATHKYLSPVGEKDE